MDRAAKLAALAADARYFLLFEDSYADKEEARAETRRRVSFMAGVYGFDPETEISAAIDQALKDAGVGT